MAKPVDIGSRSFRTQKSALDHYKALLHRYQDGQRISNPDDHTDLVALSNGTTRSLMTLASRRRAADRSVTSSDG